MINLFKKKNEVVVHACVEGQLKDIKEVNDPMFAGELIGKGMVIEPTSHTVVSPVNGTILTVFPTNHALGILCENGLELLIHIGIDTVKLKGEGFKAFVKEGQTVNVGDLLVEVDIELVKEKGYSIDTLMVVTSVKESYKIEYTEVNRKVKSSDEAFKILKI
jgi:sugar PTS system EIIA component